MVEKINHNADGIEEYDNPVPKWLMFCLYGTIIFAVGYLIIYPGFWKGTADWTQVKMYEEEMAEADKKYAAFKNKPVDVSALIGNAQAIAEGKSIFAANCMPCHGADAGGGIGPNLTDSEWLYGSGSIEDIIATVTDGTAKGMPTFASLGAGKTGKVSAFVLSLGGSGAKSEVVAVDATESSATVPLVDTATEEAVVVEVAEPVVSDKPVDVPALVGNAEAIAEGQKVFAASCAMCHGAEAKGSIGPDLTDSEWSYGSGSIEDIIATVTDGTAKGMPSMGSLGADKVGNVSAFIVSLGSGR